MSTASPLLAWCSGARRCCSSSRWSALFVYGAATIDGFSSADVDRLDARARRAARPGRARADARADPRWPGPRRPGAHREGAIVVSQLYGCARMVALPLAIAFVVAVAAVAGALTGWICHRWQIQPLIVTLGVGRDERRRRRRVDAGAPHRHRARSSSPTSPRRPAPRSVSQIPPIVVIWARRRDRRRPSWLHRTVAGRAPLRDRREPARGRARAREHPARRGSSVFALSAVVVRAGRRAARGFRRAPTRRSATPTSSAG